MTELTLQSRGVRGVASKLHDYHLQRLAIGRVPVACGELPRPENPVQCPISSPGEGAMLWCHTFFTLRSGCWDFWGAVWCCTPSGPAEADPRKPQRPRSHAPPPFAGLTHKPSCALWAPAAAPPQAPPPVPPAPRPPTHRRPRTVDTSRHCCPQAGGRYRGGLGWGTLRANGPPHGGPWRPCQCPSCRGDVPQHHGTLWHGTRVSPARRVGAVGPLAEGVGSRAVARVCAGDPHTVRQWLVAAAEHLQAFSQ